MAGETESLAPNAGECWERVTVDRQSGERGRMTVETFLDAYAIREGLYELVDGAPMRVGNATARQARIQVNLLANLFMRLGDGPCEAFGSEMGLKISEYDVRIPAAAIYCNPVDVAPDNDAKRCLTQPRVVFDILSSASTVDWLTRLIEYQHLASVDTIVQIDPDHRCLTTYVRAADNAWTMMTHPYGTSLRLRDPAVVLTADDIFRRIEASLDSNALTMN